MGERSQSRPSSLLRRALYTVRNILRRASSSLPEKRSRRKRRSGSSFSYSSSIASSRADRRMSSVRSPKTRISEGRPRGTACSFMSLSAKRCIVHMSENCAVSACAASLRSFRSSAREKSCADILERISAAAGEVKVQMSIRDTSAPSAARAATR